MMTHPLPDLSPNGPARPSPLETERIRMCGAGGARTVIQLRVDHERRRFLRLITDDRLRELRQLVPIRCDLQRGYRLADFGDEQRMNLVDRFPGVAICDTLGCQLDPFVHIALDLRRHLVAEPTNRIVVEVDCRHISGG